MLKEKDIAQFALDYAMRHGCQQAKVVLALGQENELEVRDGKVDRLHHSGGCQLNIGLYVDGSFSSISTNRLERKELGDFIDKGIIATRFLAPDPFRRLPDRELYYRGEMNDFNLYDEDYLSADIDKKLSLAHNLSSEINDSRIISASVEIDDNETVNYMIDSNGFEGESRRTQFAAYAQVCVAGNGDERPEDYSYVVTSHWNKLPQSGIASDALRLTVSKIGAEKIASGKYNVVVDRRVASRLLSPVVSAMKGEALQQHASFLLDKKGEKITSDCLTIIDNPLLSGQLGAALYDRDGVALSPMPVIQDGVLMNYYISQYMGRKMNTQATTGIPSLFDFKLGDSDTVAMLKKLHNGVYITGFNGGNCNGTTGDFSYGIEGYLVENGVITKSFGEMLLTGNMLDLWLSLEAVSNDPLPYSSWNIPSLLFVNLTLN